MTLSAAARKRLECELQRLNGELLPLARLAVEEARHQGDMSQNPDFFLAAEDEGNLLARREVIRRTLAETGPVTAISDHVVVGCVVVLDFGDGPEEFVYGSIEEQHGAVQVITPASPIGQALSGAVTGASLRLSNGLSVRVLAVRAG